MAAKVVTVDFTNVKDASGINTRRIPAGDYLAKVKAVSDRQNSNDEFMYEFLITPIKHASSTFPYYCTVTEKQLWKLRNLFVAAGINVPKSKFKLDPNRIVGKTVAISVVDGEYDGKEKSEIGSVFPASELTALVGGDDSETETTIVDDDVEDAPLEDDVLEEEEAETGTDADQFEEMDRTALKVFIKEHDANFKFLKSHTDDMLREQARGYAVNLVEEEPEEEEEEEEEPVIVPPKKTAPVTRKRKPAPVEEDELDIEDM